MPVPSTLDDLSIVIGDNFPTGSEAVFPQLDNYLRAHAAFIAQLQAQVDATGEAEIKYQLACSDLTTNLTATVLAGYFRTEGVMQVVGVRASVLTASTSGAVTVGIRANGTPMLTGNLSIDANEKTSTTAASAPTLAITELADDTEIVVEIISGGTGAKGLIVSLLGRVIG